MCFCVCAWCGPQPEAAESKPVDTPTNKAEPKADNADKQAEQPKADKPAKDDQDEDDHQDVVKFLFVKIGVKKGGKKGHKDATQVRPHPTPLARASRPAVRTYGGGWPDVCMFLCAVV